MSDDAEDSGKETRARHATEDLAAIRQTMSAYNIAGDRMRLEELAATFLPDGVLVTPTATYTGRAEIVAGLGGGPRERPAAAGPRPTVVRHHLTTSHITLSGPDTASGRTYFIVFTDVGPDHAGHYEDRLRKLDDGWLFEHRDVRIDWISEASLFGGLRAAHEARLSRRRT
jgi:hypothetical protein